MPHDIDQVNEQLQALASMLYQTAKDDPNMRRLLTCLAYAHNKRFDIQNAPDDIHKVIQYASTALTLTPNDDPGRPELLDTLGIAHGKRFKRLAGIDDLEKAIGYQSLSIDSTPGDDPNLPRQLSNLAMSHRDRFHRLSKLDDVEKAIECDSRAVAIAAQNDSDLPAYLDRLGCSHICRFERLGNLDDLHAAIMHQSCGLALAPAGHPHLPNSLGNLAVSHSRRFRHLGALSDLDHAIACQTRVLDLAPANHPDLSIHLANLAVSYNYRFERLGELSDLELAIQCGSRTLALTPNNDPCLSMRLANLAASYFHRFGHIGELSDLEQAIKYGSCALDLTPDGHTDLPLRLANLAVYHKKWFESLGQLRDLERAIEYESRALVLTPDEHTDLSNRLANLAVSYKTRFKSLGDLADLEQAIEYEGRALATIYHDRPEVCQWSFNRAISYIHHYDRSKKHSSLESSLSCFRVSCNSSSGAPRDKFKNALRWAVNACKYDALQPIEAYQATIDLLPQLIWLGATADQRYVDLKTMQTLAGDAAYAAIKISNYALALEWLEHARCIVWNQNLMLRSPLAQLRDAHPSLATRLKKVANQLHAASYESRQVQALSNLTFTEKIAQDHRCLAKEYNTLLTEARALPGFNDLLRPLTIEQLLRSESAQSATVVVINCHLDQSDALIIQPQQILVKHVPLPGFNGVQAQSARLELHTSVKNKRKTEREATRRPQATEDQDTRFESVLALLWYNVVKPILDFLGYTNELPAGNLPHIIWCPTGTIAFLPLHAAGDYDQPQSRVFDYVISSYTPTLSTLLETTSSTLNQGARVLAIGQAATPGHSRLPGTVKELEYVKTQTHGKAEYTQLIDDEATIMTVLNAMEHHDWVHIACHAHQNVSKPTESGFFLHDGVLELASINHRSFKGKGLAFLSACQTASGDEALPDEAVHLASGMLMAGYSSVIATMWSVHDEDAPLIADKVYQQLMQVRTLGNGEAGKALHDATAELRKVVGDKAFERWVPYIHIGS